MFHLDTDNNDSPEEMVLEPDSTDEDELEMIFPEEERNGQGKEIALYYNRPALYIESF